MRAKSRGEVIFGHGSSGTLRPSPGAGRPAAEATRAGSSRGFVSGPPIARRHVAWAGTNP